MAKEDDVIYLRGVKDGVGYDKLPGSGKDFVEYYITRYENDIITLSEAVCNVNLYIPTMASIALDNSLSITDEIVCATPEALSSIDCSVIKISANAYNSCVDPIYIITGAQGNSLGTKVTYGDLNGDGVSDLVSSKADGVYVFYGGSGFKSVDWSNGANANRTFVSSSTNSNFGESIVVEDLNGDGTVDLIIGDAGYSSSHGAVYVFYGGVSFASVDLSNGGTADKTFIGPAASSFFGISVTLGDFDGDNDQDLAIGSPHLSSGGITATFGAVYVFYGGVSFASVDLSNGGTADAVFKAAVGDDGFGYVISSGYLSGDTKVDLIVGRNDISNGDVSANDNIVYVFYGGVGFGSVDLNNGGVANAVFTSESPDDQFGEVVATADLNGDGIEDLSICNRGTSTTKGTVYVFYGGVSFASVDLSNSGTADAVFVGAADGGQFGSYVNFGDLNNDGKDDLVVGSSGYTVFSGNIFASSVYVFYGGVSFASVDLSSSGTADAVFVGPNLAPLVGYSFTVGNFNADNFMDLAMSSPFYNDVSSEGRIHIFFGDSDGFSDTVYL